MKNKHAKALGKLGGLATKKKGKAYFKRISKLGVEARRKKRKELGRKGICQVCGIKKVLVIDDWQKICYDEECQKHVD